MLTKLQSDSMLPYRYGENLRDGNLEIDKLVRTMTYGLRKKTE